MPYCSMTDAEHSTVGAGSVVNIVSRLIADCDSCPRTMYEGKDYYH